VRKFSLRAHHATGKNIVNPRILDADTFCTTTIRKTYPALGLTMDDTIHTIENKRILLQTGRIIGRKNSWWMPE